ncbi:MAG: hypothetical protein RLZZ86_3484, partial [Cyanobacteriota bacterium]
MLYLIVEKFRGTSLQYLPLDV